jgi:hypothetical protein
MLAVDIRFRVEYGMSFRSPKYKGYVKKDFPLKLEQLASVTT